MAYNKAKEEKKWIYWKAKEEKILREMNVPEDEIQNLRDYDWEVFKSNRTFQTWNCYELETTILTTHCQDSCCLETIQDLINCTDNEYLISLLKKTDIITLNILLLHLKKYTNHEISEQLGLSYHGVTQRLYRLRKVAKK